MQHCHIIETLFFHIHNPACANVLAKPTVFHLAHSTQLMSQDNTDMNSAFAQHPIHMQT